MSADARLTLPEGTGPRLDRRRVILAFTPVLKHPEPRAAQVMELVYGQDFDVYMEQEGWVLGQVCSLIKGSSRPGYVGWVRAEALGEAQTDPTHRVSSVSAPIFCRADLKSHILMSLPLGSRISIMQADGDYYQIGAGAYLHRQHVKTIADPETDWVSVAKSYLGQPYIWGGNGARGVDCSGLVQMSLVACGMDAPRDADLQEAHLGESVGEPSETGDLLFWPGHVGILSGPDRLLHANATHMATVEEPLGQALERMRSADVKLRTVKRL